MNILQKLTKKSSVAFSRVVFRAQTCASYDRKHWFRVSTAYDSHKGVLLIKHKPERVRCTTYHHSNLAQNWPLS